MKTNYTNLNSFDANNGILADALSNAPVPTVIFEGEELKIALANEALLAFWGKDHSIINRTLLEVLPEVKDQPFPDLLSQVLHMGITHNVKENLAYMVKNGKTEAFTVIIHTPQYETT